MGDYMFVMVPGYYYEKEEDVYMQQITKLLVNVGGIPGNWNTPGGPAVRDRAPGPSPTACGRATSSRARCFPTANPWPVPRWKWNT